MKNRVIFAGVIALVLCIVLCWASTKFSVGSYISIVGSIASLFGLWVAYMQIRSVKEISAQTQEIVNSRMVEMNRHLTLADMSRIMHLAQEVQTHLTGSKLELATLRMRDLKIEIVQLRQNMQLLGEEDLAGLNECINDLGIDIVNVSSNIRRKGQVSVDTVILHNETLLTILADLEGKLKYKEI